MTDWRTEHHERDDGARSWVHLESIRDGVIVLEEAPQALQAAASRWADGCYGIFTSVRLDGPTSINYASQMMSGPSSSLHSLPDREFEVEDYLVHRVDLLDDSGEVVSFPRIIVKTHDWDLVSSVCDRITIPWLRELCRMPHDRDHFGFFATQRMRCVVQWLPTEVGKRLDFKMYRPAW